MHASSSEKTIDWCVTFFGLCYNRQVQVWKCKCRTAFHPLLPCYESFTSSWKSVHDSWWYRRNFVCVCVCPDDDTIRCCYLPSDIYWRRDGIINVKFRHSTEVDIIRIVGAAGQANNEWMNERTNARYYDIFSKTTRQKILLSLFQSSVVISLVGSVVVLLLRSAGWSVVLCCVVLCCVVLCWQYRKTERYRSLFFSTRDTLEVALLTH